MFADGLTPAEKQPYCDKIHTLSLFSPDVWNGYFTSALMVSSLAMLFIAWTVFYVDKLQVHPAPMIGVFAISLSILMWMMPSQYFICPGPGEVLFAKTVYLDTSTESLLRAMNTMTYSWLTIDMILFNVPMLIETCLIHDMVLTLTRPMQKPDSRVKLYYIFVLINTVVIVTINVT